jgi:vesicle-associated membrane protein 72
MPLEYSFVAQATTVVAEYSFSSSAAKYRAVALQCLQSCPTDNKFTFTAEHHTYNFLVDGGFTFLVIADDKYGRQIPFAYLLNIKDEFLAKFASRARGCAENGLDKTFGPRMKYHMDYCQEHPEELSKVAGLQKSVEEVKGIMVDNIEQVLLRGENLENLVDKTDNLRFQADKFHKTGVAIRRKMWWQHKKMIGVVILIILILALVIFLSVCFSGGNCFKN